MAGFLFRSSGHTSYQDNPKFLSAEWDVENVRGTLYGVIRVGLVAKLSASEEEKDYLEAISDSFGDGFDEGYSVGYAEGYMKAKKEKHNG